MSVMTQHLVRILQCDKRYFSLTEKQVSKLEEVVFEVLENQLEKQYDEIEGKTIYILSTPEEGDLIFKSKHRADALCKLILRTPILYEPIRSQYNAMVSDRYKGSRDRSEERKEARYQRRLALIRKLNGI